jgi:hypothetical protein
MTPHRPDTAPAKLKEGHVIKILSIALALSYVLFWCFGDIPLGHFISNSLVLASLVLHSGKVTLTELSLA